nr:ribonuclease H-like domain-containing protein [Tanacetum cinerariifolium]
MKPPQEVADTGLVSEGSAKKKGRTVAVTTEDMQKRRNDVKARTTLLLALSDEHQLRFSKYKTAQELWAAILKTSGGNEATKKTKKNQLKQHGKEEVNTASFSTASTQVSPASVDIATPIDEDDIEEMDIKWNMALLNPIFGNNNNHTSYMANEKENHALVADKEAPTEFALMAKSSSENKEARGLTRTRTVPPSAQVYSPPKKDMSWTGLPKFADDTITDCSRPSPSIESNSSDLQNSDFSASEKGHSSKSIMSKPMIKFVKATNSPTEVKISKVETVRKLSVKYGEMYRNTTKSPKFRGNQRNWSNLKTQQLGKDFVMKNKACFKCGQFDHLAYDCGVWEKQGKTWPKNNNTHKSMSSRNHMTRNISYLFDYEPYDGGYVSFGQGGGKITGKGIIKIECIVLGRDFKLRDDTNVLLRTPRQHNMYSIDLNNIVPHKDLNCLVTKASADESVLWHMRLGETSGILRNFITEIENLKELKVNIIRCDNGGEFRNKEMNDFCSRKGIKREFSNARTPQQNGVTKRRNKTLIEAARTMLADAKLPGTFWAKAVNTACYVQNRVLVNKAQNKTPYELFNGRTPAIGFLKPFGCHVMILNTLDNLGKFDAKGNEGTTSTNFSGTKDAASQDVKKDMSSLRYIALPNWFHEAHLESSTCNAQDACNADALESSGNSNPTATSTNPLADYMETLTVESLIPTVSSPVLTACLDDSPESSSDTRLISKRVTNQDDIPSLDNILTLSNRFEDILGVTTNTGETNGVEADLGNMENNISASPTLTFRIHKDHPKSQIIGPVDTPVQTRTKSKEMEEQSFIATIHQKTNPALL